MSELPPASADHHPEAVPGADWTGPRHEYAWRAGPAGPGRVITFEGPDGTGKSTVAALLTGALQELGIQARLWREPGSSLLGTEARRLLKAGAAQGQTARSTHEQVGLLMQIGRAGNHHEQEAWLAEVPHGVVVRDRSWPSTVAYQRHIGLNGLQALTELGCHPDDHPRLARAPHIMGLLELSPSLTPRDEGDEGLDMTDDAAAVAWRYLEMAQGGADAGWLRLDAPQTLDAWLDPARHPAGAGALGRAETQVLDLARAQQLDHPEIALRRLGPVLRWLSVQD